jgi:Icc-related predicted phosphoesterase
MRVAALYDIHGNLPALEAVLQDIRQANVDQIVVGGDVVPGPMPREIATIFLDQHRFCRGSPEALFGFTPHRSWPGSA